MSEGANREELNPYARLTDGRAGGRSVYGHVITKFSRMGSLPHFFTHGAPLRALRARELCYKSSYTTCEGFIVHHFYVVCLSLSAIFSLVF